MLKEKNTNKNNLEECEIGARFEEHQMFRSN